MFCGNCGAENANGAKFCKSCGQPLVNSSIQKADQDNRTIGSGEGIKNSTSQVELNMITEKAKSIPKTFIAIACVAIVALIAVVAYVSKAAKTIDLNKYLTIEAEGVDGFGRVKATIDWDAIEEKYGDQLSFSNAAKSEFGVLLDLMTPIEGLSECVTVKIKENDNLSNGSTVEYSWDIDEDLDKYLKKCKVKYKDGSYTVSGLKEVGTFDAFADLTVEFDGIAPNGRANINYLGDELNYYDYSCDKSNGLKNGDVVKVTIDESKLEYYAEYLGKVPAELEKEFKVEGLESYVTKLADIDQAGMEAMQQQATDVFNAHVAQTWGDGEELLSLTYIGDYLLSSKNSDSWGTNNILILVYKAEVRNSVSNNKGDSYNKVNDIYWYIRYENLMLDAGGKTVVNISDYGTPNNRFTVDSGVGSGWWGTQTWYYYGYQSVNDLYKEAVTKYIDSYNHEDNVDESVAPVTVVEEEPEVVENNDYILPKSDKELLEIEDLEGLSAEDCKIARNEIYARHGRKFIDDGLQDYFNGKDWYKGTIEADDFQESVLSDIEIKNKDLIVKYEKEQGFN